MLCTFIIFSLLFSFSFEYQKFYYPQNCNQLNFLPMPSKINCTLDENKIYKMKDPCKIKYNVKLESESKKQYDHITELINHQQYKTFKCLSSYIQIVGQQLISIMDSEVQYNLMVTLADSTLKSAFSTKQQAYDLQIAQKSAELKAAHYVGFVRGLETFLQSITCDKKSKNCYMLALPIIISDYPQYQYRGVLVDSSRHFLPLDLLKQTVDSLMYNKMNIFHWHVVDEDSFPLELQSHPELAQYASFSLHETYSIKEVKELIRYAMVRGVRIIPEIDTPGHSASWGKAPQNSKVACSIAEENSLSFKYKGTLDITLDETYKIVEQVFKQIFLLFPDPYVHLGGDEVQLKCLNNLTQFLRLENITQQQLEIHYRRKQKKILKNLNESKTFIYWITDKILDVEEDDIVHWWGYTSLVPQIKDRKMIISRYVKQLYIDMGAGSLIGRDYYNYGTWYDMYSLNFNSQVQQSKNKKNVLGLVVTLWSQISNMYTHHTKIWIRSSSMAQRSWTSQDFPSKPDFFRRITAHERIMNRRGIPTAPATNQQCQFSPQFC